MRIRAKIGGELNMQGPGVHWIHKASDERDFPEDVGKAILTNSNYEAATGARKAAPEKEKEKEITADVVVKKTEPGRKEKKEKDREGTK